MWSDLSLRQRAQLILMGVRAGIGDAVLIRKLYDLQSLSNQYPDGGGFKDKSGNYVHPGNFVYQQLYPLYRDFIIPLGGEVDLSDAEKKRIFMTYVEDADMIIKSLYDPKSFTPHQYASLLASAVQGSFAKKNTVNKGSKFWQSYNTGKPNYDYLRIPTGLANDLIYEWAYKGIPGDMHNYLDPTGENIFGLSMSYHIPEIEVVAPKIRKFKPEPEIDWEYNEEVKGVPPIAPRPKEETKEEPIAKKIRKTYIPGFDPLALFVNFGDYDNYRYKTFKYSLDPDKVIPLNKALELLNVETIGFLLRMQDILNPEEDEFYVNPMLKTAAYGGNLFSTGSSLTDPPGGWKSLYPGINWNTDLNSIEKDDLYSINDIGEVSYPKFKDWSNGHDWNEVAPAYMQDNINDTATYGDIYDRMSLAYLQHNVDARMADRKNHPKKYTGDMHNYNNRLRHEMNLTSLGEFGDYVNGIRRSVRDIIPYGFNKGVEYLIGKPLNFVLNSFANSPVSTNGAGVYSYSPGMLYFSDSGASSLAVEDVSNNVLSWTTPSGIVGNIFPDFIENVRGSEWGNAALNALDLYLTPKMYSGKTYRGIANGADYVGGKMGNSAAATRYIGRNMLYDPMEGIMPGITIEPTGRLIPSDADNLGYNLNNIDAYTWDPTYGYRRVQNTSGTYDITNDLNLHLWMLDNFPKYFIIEDAVPRIANKIALEFNIPLEEVDLNFLKQEISDYIDNIPIEYKEMDALGTAGKDGIAYKKGIIPTILTKIHEIMHRVRQGYIEDELAETMPSDVNGKSRYDVWNNDRGQINPERNEIYTNGITTLEADILNNAYSFSKEYIKNNPNTHPLREKASDNTELRSAISEKASKEKGHIVIGDELDAYIDALSTRELFEIMNDLDNAYMQDWLSLVKNKRTSNLNTSFDLFPEEARKVGRHELAKRYNDKFFSAPVKKALKEVGVFAIPITIGNMLMGIDNQKAYGGGLHPYGGSYIGDTRSPLSII